MERRTFISRLFMAILSIIPFRGYATAAKITEKEVKKRTLKILKKQVGEENAAKWKKFNWQWGLVKDLGMDSLDAVEFIMELEKEFAISIPDAEAEKVVTLQQAVNLLLKLLNKH